MKPRKMIRYDELKWILDKITCTLNPTVDLQDVFMVGMLKINEGVIEPHFVQKEALLDELKEWGLEK